MRLLQLLTALCLLLPTLQAQDEDARSTVDAALQGRINSAIARGVAGLLREQEIDGSWREHAAGYPNGQTSLTVYTLLKCGTAPDHPAIQRALDYLRLQPPSKTYSCAIQIMMLCTLDPEAHSDWIEEITERLVSWQKGGYAYPDGNVDLSNTQYAALGLRAASQQGQKIPAKVWERLAAWTLKQQQTEGLARGFRYHGQHAKVTGSMTSAGVAVLAICEEMLSRKMRTIPPALDSGALWLEQNFEVKSNPASDFKTGVRDAGGAGHPYYYLYGLERVGALLETSHFGPHDWYREGATWLVDDQKADGKWSGQSGTCFALLFLTRATGSQSVTGVSSGTKPQLYGKDDPLADVSLRAAGDSPLKIWISGLGEMVYEDFEWDGEQGRGVRVVRVEYRVQDQTAPGGSRVMASVPGDQRVPQKNGRYPARLEFAARGAHKLFARVVLLPPGVQTLDEEQLFAVDSEPLEVLISWIDDPRLDGYSRDAGRNIMRGQRMTLETSSKRENDSQAAGKAFDGRVGTFWLSAKDDPTPWLRVEFAKPLRGNTLLFTPAVDRAGGAPPPNQAPEQRRARVKKIAVRLNRAKQAIEVDLEQDPRVKTVLELGRAARIRQLEVTVLEVEPGGREDRGVGFAEIELVLDKRR